MSDESEESPRGMFVSFAFAYFASEIATAPLDRVEFILQSQNELLPFDQGIIDWIVHLTREEGFLSFWRGALASTLQFVPTIGFGIVQRKLASMSRIINPGNSVLSLLVSGGAIIAKYPLEFARVRMATDVKKENGERQYKGYFDLFKKCFTIRGVVSFCNGLILSFIHTAVYEAVYYALLKNIEENVTFIERSDYQNMAIVASLIVYPIYTIRNRMIVNAGEPETREIQNSCACIHTNCQDRRSDESVSWSRSSYLAKDGRSNCCASCFQNDEWTLFWYTYDF